MASTEHNTKDGASNAATSSRVKTGGKSAFIPEFFAPLEITGLRSAQRVVLSTCQLGLVLSLKLLTD